ncbi:hypothetical protein [Sporomusa malonica]|uniref:Uncharacterized protein n=1 Tax=Sporomusa malonica TaxID=112901 RepID=A0A1W2F7S3_9FIRM|nr:hypothetical protein [Sporomusa malonica]SMD17925.1 hypothetical protein SAMN04488500_1553 [Sporomusa malonica]
MNILDIEPLIRKHTRSKSEDIKSQAWLAVVQAFAYYNSAKGVPPPGYVESRVKFAVWNALKKEYQLANREDIECCLEDQPDHTDVTGVVELKLLGKGFARG